MDTSAGIALVGLILGPTVGLFATYIGYQRFRAASKVREGFVTKQLEGVRADLDKLLELEIRSRLEDHEKRIDELKGWKHRVGEAYLPGAVDALKDRVTLILDFLRNSYKENNNASSDRPRW